MVSRTFLVLTDCLSLAMIPTAYFCTRGSDGELFLCFGSYFGFAITYVVLCLTYLRHAREIPYCRHAPAYVLASSIPLLIDPQLEEMGGMLNYFIPMLAAGVVASTVGILLVRDALRILF
jgi:hypothetical protein